MMKLLCVLLAIISHTPTSLHGHTLTKREYPLPTDTGEPIADPSISRENLWLEQDDRARYLQDQVKNADEYPPYHLLSSLTADYKGLGKPQHLEIPAFQQTHPQKSIPQTEQQRRENSGEEYEESEEYEEEPQDLGKQEEYDQHSEEQLEDEQQQEGRDHYYEEEYRRRQEEKYEQPEVHLFNPPGPQHQGNMEEFHHPHPHTIPRVERPASTNFSYIHPEQWSLDNPECSGRLQSPVNLDSNKLVRLDVPLSLIWTGYWNQPQNLTITDNGHSVQLNGTWDKKAVPFISGGPLVGDYLFAELHFHWSSKDSVGSEHTINNNSFPMEMHMVHYKRDYETFNGALNYDDGLAVVAFLFEISEIPNFGINFLTDRLSKIQNKPARVPIPVKPYPLAFLHFIFQEDYVSYVGSLTTPPCREIVTWLVSSRPLTISRKQLESFRKISNKWPATENYRPQQALNGRNLYYVAH